MNEPEVTRTVTPGGTVYFHVSQLGWGRRFTTRDAALAHHATLVAPVTRRAFLRGRWLTS